MLVWMHIHTGILDALAKSGADYTGLFKIHSPLVFFTRQPDGPRASAGSIHDLDFWSVFI